MRAKSTEISLSSTKKRFARINSIIFTSYVILRRTSRVGHTAIQIRAFGVGKELP